MMFKKSVLLGLKGYQKFISPIKPKRVQCRFYPTCSRYAIIAVHKYGVIKGLKMTGNRLMRCHPNNEESCMDQP